MTRDTPRAALRRWMLFSIGTVVMASHGAVSPQERVFPPFRILPVDEAAGEPALAAVRDRFLRALRARDVESVVELIHPDLRGETFIRNMRMPAGSFVDGAEALGWGALERALTLGGAFTTTRGAVFDRREFCAPYAYANYPRPGPPSEMSDPETGEVDAWVVIGRNVAVRTAPSIKAPVMARVSYELLPTQARYARDESGADVVWQAVFLSDGRYGFIANHLLWGGFDSHACFAEIDGRWLLTKFGRGLG